MKKKLLSLSLALALVCSNFTGVLAKDVSDYIVKLQDAKMLEMDKINKYNMNGDLSKSESLKIILQALGYTGNYTKTAINLGMIDEKDYNPNVLATKKDFLAMLLKAMSYKDAYKDTENIAKTLGFLSQNDDINSKITKSESIDYIFTALNKELQNGTSTTLGQYLVNKKFLSEDTAKNLGILLDKKDDEDIHILYFNDFHGNISEEVTGKKRNMGMAKMVGYVNEFTKNHTNTIVLSGGDNYQGTADSNLTFGKPVSSMMKGMKITASAVGNHEFDWGYEKISSWSKDGNFSYLASNIYDKKTNTPVKWAKPYMIVKKGGLNIGIIGLAHPDTPSLAKEEYTQGFEFKDPIESAKYWTAYLKDGKAQEGKVDLVVALTHLDSDQDSKTNEITGIATKLAQVKGIDLILSAHSHRAVSGKVNEVPILQAYCYGRAIGQVTIDVENNKVKSIDTSIFNGDSIKDLIIADSKTEKFYQELQKELAPIKNEILGVASDEFTHNRTDKGTVTLLGRWACETMAKRTNSQIAIQNGGGLRRTLAKGNITMGDMYEIMPFDNYLVVMDLKGSDLVKAIEHGINMPNTTDGAFSGLKVEYDDTKPYENKITKITLEDGTPIEMDKTYKVVVNDFMFTGGDGYNFKNAVNVNETYIPVRDVLVEDIKEQGTITPKKIDYMTEISGIRKAA